MPNLRLFIAINFSVKMQQNLLKLIKDMQHHFPSGNLRWVKPENIHLTLKFLGDIPSDKLINLKRAVDKTSLQSYKCSAFVAGLGAYPSINRPCTIWLGTEPDQNLLDLHKNLNLILESSGFPKKKNAFKPHITLARVPDRLSLQEINAISGTLKTLAIPEFGIIRFEAIKLIKSELTRTGPIYTILQTADLLPSS